MHLQHTGAYDPSRDDVAPAAEKFSAEFKQSAEMQQLVKKQNTEYQGRQRWFDITPAGIDMDPIAH